MGENALLLNITNIDVVAYMGCKLNELGRLIQTNAYIWLVVVWTGGGQAAEWPLSAVGASNIGFPVSTTPALQAPNQSM